MPSLPYVVAVRMFLRRHAYLEAGYLLIPKTSVVYMARLHSE